MGLVDTGMVWHLTLFLNIIVCAAYVLVVSPCPGVIWEVERWINWLHALNSQKAAIPYPWYSGYGFYALFVTSTFNRHVLCLILLC